MSSSPLADPSSDPVSAGPARPGSAATARTRRWPRDGAHWRSKLPALTLFLVAATTTEAVLGEILEPFLRRTWTVEHMIALYETTIQARVSASLLGIVVIVQAAGGLLVHDDFAPLGRRLSIVTFAGIFLPVALLAIGVRIPPQLVLLATAAGTCLGLMSLLAVAFERRWAWIPRALATAAAVAVLVPFVSLCLQVVPAVSRFGRHEDVQQVLRLGGESLFLLFASMAAVASIPRSPGVLAWIGRILGLVVGLSLSVGILVVDGLGHDRFANMMYAVLGLGVTADSAIAVAIVGSLVGAFVAALFAPASEGRRRVIATGATLMLLAGYGPSSTAEVIVATAGALVVARGLSAR